MGQVQFWRLCCLLVLTLSKLNSQTEQFKVEKWPRKDQLVYTGFIQVDDAGSTLFYQLQGKIGENLEYKTPLIIWLQGGPGWSSLVGNYQEIGPFKIAKNSETGELEFQPRDINWNQDYHILFIDSPITVGFSQGASGQVVINSKQTAQYLIRFLNRFYNKYSMMTEYDLYIFGESYAGHYVAAFANEILLTSSELTKRLKGIGVGNGLFDTSKQELTFSSMAFANGFAFGPNQKKLFNVQFDLTNSRRSNKYKQYLDNYDNGIYFVRDYAGQRDPYNLRQQNAQNNNNQYLDEYLNKPEIKDMFGIPQNYKYQFRNGKVWDSFGQDFIESQKNNFELLFKKIKVLLYVGRDDIVCTYQGIWEFLLTIPSDWFLNSKHICRTQRKNLIIDNNISGGFRRIGDIYLVLFNEAGHLVPADDPELAKWMVDHFIRGDNNGVIQD